MDRGAWWAAVHEIMKSWTQLSDFTSLSCIGEGNGCPLQCPCPENPRDGEPGGLPSVGSHRVRHDWSDLAAQNGFINYCCSVAQLCLTLCKPMDCSTPGLPVLHHLPEFVWTHVHRISDAIQPSHPLSSPSPPAFNLSQHQVLFKWIGSLYQVAEVLELQFQHQSLQSIFRVDFL